MSNPGVITLASIRGCGRNIQRLDIEDNIGESIHFHVNSFRFDFSVGDFLDFSEKLVNTSFSLDVFKKHKLKNLDPYFLFEINDLISDISHVEIQDYRLSDLRALVCVGVPKIGDIKLKKRISDTPAYRYLRGLDGEFKHYSQHNYPRMDNVSRLESLRNSIQKNGYPCNGSYIVLFGDQKLIRDGQHRASILAAQGGLDQVVPVMVIHFRGTRWKHNSFKQLPEAVARKVLSFGRRKISSLLYRLKCFTGTC